MTQQVLHPMVKMQRQVESLVASKILRPSGFTLQDPVSELIEVESWDDD
jgi:hypothetical protein